MESLKVKKVISKGPLKVIEAIKHFGSQIIAFRAGDKIHLSNLQLPDDASIKLDKVNHILTIEIRNFKDSDYLVIHDEKGFVEKRILYGEEKERS